jgi:hypothetical protein
MEDTHAWYPGISEALSIASSLERDCVVMQLLLCHKGLGLSVLHLHHLHFTSGPSEVDYTKSFDQQAGASMVILLLLGIWGTIALEVAPIIPHRERDATPLKAFDGGCSI